MRGRQKQDTHLPGVFVRRIRNVVEPDKIILFGSRARGDAKTGSDYDLLVVAPSRLPRWRRTPKIYGALAGTNVSIDIVWWTRKEIEEWQNVQSHFITTAVREGRVLYEKAP